MTSFSMACVRSSICSMLLVGWLAACSGGPTLPAPEAAATVTLPMQLDAAHASIEAAINGQPVRMLLDTGADQIVLSPQAAMRLGLEMRSSSTSGSGAAGTYSASLTSIGDLAVGGIHRRQQTAYVVPLPDEFVYDGVLGTPFFATLVTTLDYQRHEITLHAGASFAGLSQTVRVPIRLESGKLLVLASAAGVAGWFAVDTGAGNALTFFTPSVQRYGLRDAFSPAVHMVTGVSPGGYTRGTLVRIPEVTIGPHVFKQVVVELSDAEKGFFASALCLGNLGGELWRRFSVTLDYAGGQMYLAPNDAFDQPFDGHRSGLAPSLVDGLVKIVEVVEGSPAAEAGMHAGEVILAVNGASTESQQGRASRASLDRVVRALRAPSGTPVRLSVRGASGAERDVTMLLRDLL